MESLSLLLIFVTSTVCAPVQSPLVQVIVNINAEIPSIPDSLTPVSGTTNKPGLVQSDSEVTFSEIPITETLETAVTEEVVGISEAGDECSSPTVSSPDLEVSELMIGSQTTNEAETSAIAPTFPIINVIEDILPGILLTPESINENNDLNLESIEVPIKVENTGINNDLHWESNSNDLFEDFLTENDKIIDISDDLTDKISNLAENSIKEILNGADFENIKLDNGPSLIPVFDVISDSIFNEDVSENIFFQLLDTAKNLQEDILGENIIIGNSLVDSNIEKEGEELLHTLFSQDSQNTGFVDENPIVLIGAPKDPIREDFADYMDH